MLFFSSRTPLTMPKTAGIPKSLLADVNKVKSRLATLEKNHTSLAKTKLAAIEKAQASLAKELKDSMRGLNEALRKQQKSAARQDETGKEREAQTQRIQPLPQRQDEPRHEHGRCGQSMEGERRRILLVLHARTRTELAIPHTTILADAIVEEQRR